MDDYERYGGRGITVCERWQTFENFLKDVGSAPSEKHSIDRINSDGNYEPGNVRWATNSEQIRNSRAHKEYTIGRYYERTKHPRAAAFYYRNVTAYWPDTTWAVLAQGRMDRLGYGEERASDVEETPMQPLAPMGPAMPLPSGR